MEEISNYDIEQVCSKIYKECTSLVSWRWDDRFQSILSEFPAEQEKEVIQVLEKHFDVCWDSETIDFAPGKIKSVAKGLGEVREGQRLFSSNPDRGALLLGAYWPWQNGKKISLRMLMDVPKIDMGNEAFSSQDIQSPLYT